MLLALILFILTYVLLMIFTKYRAIIALCSAAIFIILGILPLNMIVASIEWNVIMMIGGTMGIVSLFIMSGMPAFLADCIIAKVPNIKWAVVSLALFAGVISAFVDNVATVLMVAPVALEAAKKLKISPVAPIIAIAISSNLQGAATLVGDTTSILLGGYAGMDFLDFFFMDGKPGMFWIVELGALASMFILLYYFRKEKTPVNVDQKTVVTDYFPTVLLCAVIVALISVSFFPNKHPLINGFICVGLMIIGLLRELIFKKNTAAVKTMLKEIDYNTLLLLAGLFLVIAGITQAGVINEIAALFVRISGSNLFVSYTLIVWFSVIISAFIDNIPYVATMLPVVSGMATLIGVEPHVLYLGLLCGATLGGNLTPIGASANIAGIGILTKNGYEVKTKDFMKMGIPFTLSAVIVGYVLIWIIWA